MRITLSGVTKGPKDSALPPTSLEFHSKAVTLAQAETERRPTVLGLIASGRMRPDRGSVEINRVTDYGLMRERVALVDALDVSDPAADLTVAQVVTEELMFSGRIGHRRAVTTILSSLGMADRRRSAMANLDPADRIRLLTELAVLRDGVQGVVITSPDRHGGDPQDWWAVGLDLAARGYAVLVIAGEAAARALGEGTHAIDEAEARTEGTAA